MSSVDFFYPNVCQVCKRILYDKHSRKRCSQCKLVVYCSVDHQKQNWPTHQTLCRVIKDILLFTEESNIFDTFSKDKSWNSIKSLAMCLTETMMLRPLRIEERQMLSFPVACKICHSLDTKKLSDCNKCHFVSYCSKEHQESDRDFHTTICSQLKLCFELDIYMIDPNFRYPSIKTPILSSYRDLPDDIEDFITQYVELTDDTIINALISTEMLTCVTTLLYAFEQATSRLLIQNGELTIHVVGAEALENTLIPTIEVLLHWLDDIVTLNLVFIGPECIPLPDPNPMLCPHCFIRKRVKISHERCLYHYFTLTPVYSKPNIILAYNCGFHEKDDYEYDPWKYSLPCFLNIDDVLVVITSYTKEEAEQDFKRLMEFKPCGVNASVLSKCLKNPFRSIRPYRDWEKETVFYQNNYVTIVETSNTFERHFLME